MCPAGGGKSRREDFTIRRRFENIEISFLANLIIKRIFSVETLECSDNSDNSRDKSAKLKRSRTRASPGTVQDVLSRLAKRGDDLEDDGRPHQAGSARQPTYQRTSTKAAPGTVRNLRANFESQ